MTLAKVVKEVLKTLTIREERIILMRFGLEDGKCKTLKETGEAFVVTRERIRQIEAKALRKLRHPSISRGLKPYLKEEYSDEMSGEDKLLITIFGERYARNN